MMLLTAKTIITDVIENFESMSWPTSETDCAAQWPITLVDYWAGEQSLATPCHFAPSGVKSTYWQGHMHQIRPPGPVPEGDASYLNRRTYHHWPKYGSVLTFELSTQSQAGSRSHRMRQNHPISETIKTT